MKILIATETYYPDVNGAVILHIGSPPSLQKEATMSLSFARPDRSKTRCPMIMDLRYTEFAPSPFRYIQTLEFHRSLFPGPSGERLRKFPPISFIFKSFPDRQTSSKRSKKTWHPCYRHKSLHARESGTLSSSTRNCREVAAKVCVERMYKNF